MTSGEILQSKLQAILTIAKGDTGSLINTQGTAENEQRLLCVSQGMDEISCAVNAINDALRTKYEAACADAASGDDDALTTFASLWAHVTAILA